MSAYTRGECFINNQESLVEALNELGFDHVEVHETPQALYGYHGDVRPEKAHVIIRRKYIGGSSNDIGFVKKENGTYEAIISDYDKGSLGYSNVWLGKLSMRANACGAAREAKKRGLRVTKKEDEKGRIHVQVMGRMI